MRQAQVDLINYNGTKGQGDVANIMLNSKLDPGFMRPWIADNGQMYITVYRGGDRKKPESYQFIPVTNATLRRDEWKQLDEAVLKISETRLGGIQDLISKGLTYNLGNAMGTTVLEWHDQSDMGEAEVTMDGISRSKGDRPVFEHGYLPIPIIHFDYEINARILAASRNLGNPLDTTSAERAARKVNERLENMLFTNVTYSWGEKDSNDRNTIYSYINHPDRQQVSLGTDWDASAATGKSIVDQVISFKQTSINAKQYGPWMLYIPTAYETILDEDYVGSNPDTAPNTTIRQRIEAIEGIQGVKVVDTLPANNVLLVQMNTSTVRLVRGMGIQNVQWQEEGNMVTKYKVMTIQVPQIRADQDGNCGIVHAA